MLLILLICSKIFQNLLEYRQGCVYLFFRKIIKGVLSMKGKHSAITIFLMIMVLAVSFSVNTLAQEAAEKKDDKKKYSPAERPEENYLARFHALDRVYDLMRSNLEQIYMLKVIVSNFGDQGWNEGYESVYEGYKKGMDYYYKRDIIYARVELEDNKKNIGEMYKKVAEKYKEQTQGMLNQCANMILNLSLDERARSNPDRSNVLNRNMSRLRIAYGQYDDAERAVREQRNQTAVLHYRVSKTYAIKILEQLNPEEAKGKYDVHKADNLNRILNPKSEESAQ